MGYFANNDWYSVSQSVNICVPCMVVSPGHIEINTYIPQGGCMLTSRRRK